MSAPKQRPTLRTIAELSGVAVATVSRALADDPKIAQTTRDRISKIASSVGYEPDRAARRLRTGRTMVLNLILDPHFEVLGFGNALLMGLTRALEHSGYNLVVTPQFSESDSIRAIRRIVTNRQADGIFFTRTAPFDARVRFLQEHGFPFISHGRTEFSNQHPWVDFDNEDFAYRATRRLVDLGCKKICAILPPDSLTFHQHLRYGLMRAVRETGVDYHIPDCVTLDSPMRAITDWAHAHLKHDQQVDGFICPGEASYLAIRTAVRNLDLRFGQDVRAVSKSISGILDQIEPQGDMIHEDIEDAGRLMAEQLLKVLSDKQAALPGILQRPRVVFPD
ncbi:LacI family transcriptional regulator [Paracoccus sp. Z330]|uniref:LacI family transcriptional regulator n=1 Tax=Paracoccus onchidii TaxID=3017813 RepID=A0ABT4ZHQ7_9RHOB|nr:LacI family transcriptional regulator [Paracoccus onchidii]MDB6178276.1 LacI family transcriptional regulator [Paracoccus onchidii]